MRLYLREEYFGSVVYNPTTGKNFNLDAGRTQSLIAASQAGKRCGDDTWLDPIIGRDQTADRIQLLRIRNSVARPGVLSAPLKAFFNITKRCNLYCAHCYNCSGERESPELPLSAVLASFDQMHSHGIFKVTLAGGEPMFHRHFDDILSHLAKTDFTISIVTNGICLTDRRARLLEATPVVRSITVSLDGASSDTNDRVRGTGSFHRTLAGVRTLRKHYERELALRITLMRTNIGETDRFAALAKELGASEIKVNSINPYGRAVGRNDLLISNEEYTEARDRLAAAAHQLGIPIEVPAHKYQRDDNDQIGLCRAGEETCEIDGDGHVFPCSFSFGRFCAGNVADTPLQEILIQLQLHSINNAWCQACKGRGGKAEKVYGRAPRLMETVLSG